jgi:hypothetical protein
MEARTMTTAAEKIERFRWFVIGFGAGGIFAITVFILAGVWK